MNGIRWPAFLLRAGRFALGVSLLLLPEASSAAIVDLAPNGDNTLYQSHNPGQLPDPSNGAGIHLFVGKTKDGFLRRTALRFDVAAAIPPGSTITAATLTLYCNNVKTTSVRTVAVRRFTIDWGEGASDANGGEGKGTAAAPVDLTWFYSFFNSSLWAAPGGDFVGSDSATAGVGAAGNFYVWSSAALAADVQGWLDTPASSFGWILIGDESAVETAKRFSSRQNSNLAQRPKLTITYTTSGSSGACCSGSSCQITTPATCTALGGLYQGDGTVCSPNPCGPTPTGACCAVAGTCSVTTEASCTSGGGSYQGDGTTCAAVECVVELTPFVDPLPIPVVATPTSGTPGGTATYTLAMREIQQQLHRDLPPTWVWGFDDGVHGPLYPGPTIEAFTNQPVTVTWANDLRVGGTGPLRTSHFLPVDTGCIHGAENTAKTVVHLHGGHVPESADGYPEATFVPGQQATYVYPNGQQAASLWYHDHALGVTRLNVTMGLAGLYVIRDAVENALNIPNGTNEIPLVLQDREFLADGSLSYPAMWMEHVFGDKILANGKVWPFLEVRKGKYRFRIYNGSTSRTYRLSLLPPSGTMYFTVIGTEGGLLPAPIANVPQVTVGPGERIDVVLNFQGYATGQEIFLRNDAPAPFPGSPGAGVVADVMKFRILAQNGDRDALPASLRSVTPLDPASAVVTRDFVLRKGLDDGCGQSPWLINGLSWEDITEYPELGTTEIWRFVNDSGVSHPMHLHLVMFQVLDRQAFVEGPGGEIVPVGNPVPPPAEEDGWKDTAMVGPNQILRIIAHFDGWKGRYAYHCHILEHEDHEMMRQFQTIQCGDAVLDPTEECDDGNTTVVDGCTARCRLDESVEFGGTAVGGSVSVVVDGVAVTVTTTPGQSGAAIAAALAAAINANPQLIAKGVAAISTGNILVVAGDIQDVTITDAGLSDVLTLWMAGNRLRWTSVGGVTGYDAARGSIDTLRATGGNFEASALACLANDRIATWLDSTDVPPAGSAWWYLVRRQPSATWDTGVGSPPVTMTICP